MFKALVIAAACVGAANASVCPIEIDGSTYDLSSMTKTAADSDWVGTDITVPVQNLWTYGLNVCAVSTSTFSDDCSKGDGFLCQYKADATGKAISFSSIIGSTTADPPPSGDSSWSKVDGGIMLTTTNGTPKCFIGGTNIPRVMQLTFKCASADGPGFTVLEDNGPATAEDKCIFRVEINSVGACSGSASGLSGGWFFIIFLLVGALLYVALGCLYKTKKVGTTGMESMPNIEFWRSFPGLVKAGCMFAKSGCKGGGEQYDEL